MMGVEGLDFVPCCEKEFPRGAMKDVSGQMSVRRGSEATEFTVKAIAYAKDAGIELNRDAYNTTSKLAWITQTPKEFDFRSTHWPAEFHSTDRHSDRARSARCCQADC